MFKFSTKLFYTYVPIFIPIIIILFAICCRIRLINIPLERDEGEYAYVGQQLLKGVLPIVSIHHLKLPGIYVMYALIELLFGETYKGIHLGLLIINIFTSICIYFISKRFFSLPAALMASAIFSVMSLSQRFQGFTANAEHFVILFALLGILSILNAFSTTNLFSIKSQKESSSSSGQIFFSGLFLGISYTLKQHAVFFIVFVFLFFLYKCITEKTVRFAIFNVIVFGAGVIIPLSIISVVYFLTGYFKEFWWWTFYYPRTYASLIPWETGQSNFIYTFKSILTVFWSIFTFSAFSILSLFLIKRWNVAIFCFVFFILSLLTVCIGFSFYPHYFLYIIPAISLICAGGINNIDFLIKKYCNYSWGNSLGVFSLLLFLLICVNYEKNYLLYLNGNEILRQVYGSHPFPESLTIGNYIKHHSKPEDIILVYGSEPQIYFYANRKSATGFIYTYEMIANHPYVHQFQLKMAKEIETSKPKFFVDIKMLGSWWAGRPIKTDNYIFDWTDRYKKANYKEVGLVENGILQTGQFYHTPKSDQYIKIYKRIK